MNIRILQIRDINTCNYCFASYNTAMTNNLSLDDYEEVDNYFYIINPSEHNNYSIFVTEKEIMHILDKVFDRYNLYKPLDFKGHSMSVSDIVAIDDEYYYCDIVGWKKLGCKL